MTSFQENFRKKLFYDTLNGKRSVRSLTQTYRWPLRIATIIYCVYMLFFSNMYHFMALNVLLAYIPLEISFHFKQVSNRLFILLGMLWLLFYPNAPYLFTDFFHLEKLSIYRGMNQVFILNLSDWFSFSLLTIGICVYGLFGMATIFTTLNECIRRNSLHKKWQEFFFLFLVTILSSVAIFVGRFDRLHSIHLFTKPVQTLKIIFFNWSFDKLLFIFLFTGLQLILLATIVGINKMKTIDTL